MCMVPPVYVKCYARHFIQGISFNPRKNLETDIITILILYDRKETQRRERICSRSHY